MFSIISIVMFIMAVYLMNKMFIGFQPGSKKVNSDVSRFREQAAKWKDQLITWNEEEIELFSFVQSNQVSRRGFGKSFEGVIQSIYHEPMLYYHYKEYPSAKKNAIIFARTHKYEIVYRIRAKVTQVFVNESYLGSINPDGTLEHTQKKETFGRVIQKDPYRKPILIGDREMGSVVLPAEKSKVNPRAFDLDEKMDEREQVLFMVMGIYEVIHHITGSQIPH
jgi:hypothetical protein